MIDNFCTPCGIAQDALTSNNCTGVTDSDIICVGTCRTLFDNAINGCDNAVSHNCYIISAATVLVTMECGRMYRAVACDVTSAALNQNVWQKHVAFVQEKVCFNYSVAVERRTAEITTV